MKPLWRKYLDLGSMLLGLLLMSIIGIVALMYLFEGHYDKAALYGILFYVIDTKNFDDSRRRR